MRRGRLAVLVLALSACSFQPYGERTLAAEQLPVTSRPIPLDSGHAALTAAGRLHYRGGVELDSASERFGGLSGLVVSADGTRFLAVNDLGNWLWGGLAYDEAGNLLGMTGVMIAPLLDEAGIPLAGKSAGDAEALTAVVANDLAGDVLVGFEREHRVWRYAWGRDGAEARAAVVTMPREIRLLESNAGLEALAALPGARLLAIGEDPIAGQTDNAGWLVDLATGNAETLGFRRRDPFSVTDLALLPGGDVVVLERRFSPLSGVGAEVRIVKAADIVGGVTLDGEIVADLPGSLSIDNMEGISARTGANGETLIYMVADDNFNIVQRTVLLMFELR